METEILLEEWSPVCNMQAFVEKDKRTYYFYLWVRPNSEETEMRSCWICNRVEAPDNVEKAFMEKGEPPRMPAEFVRHDLHGIDLEDGKLRVQWFEEGDAAALFCGDELLAVIPCFSGYNGFHGYSAYAKGTGPFAWELEQAKAVFAEKADQSQKFWGYFETDYWGEVQTAHLAALERFFGRHERYFAIDGNHFPPKALVQGRRDDVVYGITAGVSLIPMPMAEMSYREDYEDYRRMEIGFACRKEQEPLVQRIYSMMSSLASYPWKEITFLGHGHTIPYNGIEGYADLLLLNSKLLPEIDAPVYEKCFGEDINLLWIVPITQDECDFIVENGVEAYLAGKRREDIHVFG